MCVSLLINHGASIYATLKNPSGYSSLHQAVRFGFIECIKLLTRNGIHNDLPSEELFETPLHVAARYGRADCIPILTDAVHSCATTGPDSSRTPTDLAILKAQTKSGQTALHVAAESGQLRWFEELLSYGADMQAPGNKNRSVLHSSAIHGHVDTVSLLLSSWGADPTSLDEDGLSPLLCAVIHRHFTCAQLLVESVSRWRNSCLSPRSSPPSSIPSPSLSLSSTDCDQMGRNALHWAAIHNNADFGLFLLTNTNIPIDDRTCNGDTFLHLACSHGHFQFLHLLLSNITVVSDQNVSHSLSTPPIGTSETKTESESKTETETETETLQEDVEKTFHGPLSQSQNAKHNVQHSYRILNIDATNDEGQTALHVAARHGHVDCLVRLLESRSKQEARDRWGQTALHLAAAHGQENCVKELVDRGSEKNAQSAKGNSPLHLAARNGHSRCITLLGSQGANLNAINAERDTPLHEAARSNHHDCVAVLLKLRAQQLPGHLGLFPIHYAALNGDIDSPLFPTPAAAASSSASSKGRSMHNAVFTDDKGRNALHFAVAKGHVALSLHLLECGYDLSAADFSGWTVLHYGASHAQKAVIMALYQHPRFDKSLLRSTSVPRDGSRTIIHVLLQSPRFHLDVLRFLLEKDKRLAVTQSSHRKNPLHFAVTSNLTEAVALLLEFIDDPKQAITQTDIDGHSVLHYSLCFSSLNEITLLLLDKIKHSLRAEVRNCQSTLEMAIVLDEVQAVEFLVSRLRHSGHFGSVLEEARALAARLDRKLCLEILDRHLSSPSSPSPDRDRDRDPN